MAEEILATFARQFPAGPCITADLRLSVGEPQVTVLFGPSGAGKSTVLRCLAGLDCPTSGVIKCGGEIWFDHATRVFLSPQNRNVGYLSQDYSLFPHLNVRRNIIYGLRALPAAEQDARLEHVMRLLELHELEHRMPAQLSGGQQQRVALARSLVRRPRVLLLDEPLSAVDAPTRQRIRGELRHVLKQLTIPTVLVTHDRAEALALGDELAIMVEGRLIERGPVQDVFNRPTNLAAAGILAIETVQSARIVSATEELITIEVAGIRMSALPQKLPKDAHEVFACIRAEDVMLIKGETVLTSARNRLPATVRRITPEPPMIRIDLDCGFPLTALLTRQACEELALRDGDTVTAVVKAPAVHLIAREQ
jgi:molybdate transport system ATP-binding protein